MKKLKILFLLLLTHNFISAQEAIIIGGRNTKCDCYYNCDCKGQTCGTYDGFCGKGTGSCTCTSTGTKPSTTCDGRCGGKAFFFTGERLATVAKSLANLMLAFEKTARENGGMPDPNLILVAQRGGISHDAFIEVKYLITRVVLPLTVGQTHYNHLPFYRGHYNIPVAPDDDNDDYGTIEKVDNDLLTVMALTRQSLVSEILSPGIGNYDRLMDKIKMMFPNYHSYGRCEYPHPIEHEHDFGYDGDGFLCTKEEIRPGVDLITNAIVPNNQSRKLNNEIKGEKAGEDEILLYPNPSKAGANIEFFVPESVVATVELLDISGRSIKSIYKGTGKNDIIKLEIKSDELSNGVYFCKIQIGEKVYTKKMDVLK